MQKHELFGKLRTHEEIKNYVLIKTTLSDGRKFYTAPERLDQTSFPENIISQSKASILEIFRLSKKLSKQPKAFVGNFSMYRRQTEPDKMVTKMIRNLQNAK